MKYKTLKYFRSSTQILDIAKIHFLEIDNESKLVKNRALENNQLYGNVFVYSIRHRDLQKAEDKDGNTPLQYLSAKTPLAAIKALDPLGEEDTTTGDTVSVATFGHSL